MRRPGDRGASHCRSHHNLWELRLRVNFAYRGDTDSKGRHESQRHNCPLYTAFKQSWSLPSQTRPHALSERPPRNQYGFPRMRTQRERQRPPVSCTLMLQISRGTLRLLSGQAAPSATSAAGLSSDTASATSSLRDISVGLPRWIPTAG